jgi:DNA-binding PadR family transcriptional regulator
MHRGQEIFSAWGAILKEIARVDDRGDFLIDRKLDDLQERIRKVLAALFQPVLAKANVGIPGV